MDFVKQTTTAYGTRINHFKCPRCGYKRRTPAINNE